MGKSSRIKKAGREFEELVARLESSGLPPNAVVKSPDTIMDKVSNTPREVDASIRYQLGTVPVLVVIECRDRSRAAEQTWIEQIASKKNDIGASIAIGVSAKGFSKGAQEKAYRYGILLRETKEVTAADIANSDITLHHLSVTIKAAEVLLLDEMSGESVVLALDGSPFEASKPFILNREDGSTLSFDEFMSSIVSKHNDWPAAPVNDCESRVLFEFDTTKHVVSTRKGSVPIAGIQLVFSGGMSVTPLRLSKALNYVSGSQRLAQFQDWNGKLTIRQREIDIGVELILK